MLSAGSSATRGGTLLLPLLLAALAAPALMVPAVMPAWSASLGHRLLPGTAGMASGNGGINGTAASARAAVKPAHTRCAGTPNPLTRSCVPVYHKAGPGSHGRCLPLVHDYVLEAGHRPPPPTNFMPSYSCLCPCWPNLEKSLIEQVFDSMRPGGEVPVLGWHGHRAFVIPRMHKGGAVTPAALEFWLRQHPASPFWVTFTEFQTNSE